MVLSRLTNGIVIERMIQGNKKRILVTGAGGFIGRHIVNSLSAKDFDLLTLSRTHSGGVSSSNHIVHDLTLATDFTDFLRSDDLVIHLACLPLGPSESNPELSFKVNFEATGNILKACSEVGVTLINISSSEVYGNTNGFCADEKFPLRPLSIYGKHKVLSEQVCDLERKKGNINYVNLRLSNVFGWTSLNLPRSTVETNFIRSLKNGKPLLLSGHSNDSRDFIFVSDIVKAIEAIIDLILNDSQDLNGECFNLASGIETSIIDLAELACEICKMDKNNYIVFGDSFVGEKRFFADITKARNILNFKPTVSLSEFMSILSKTDII